MKQTQKTEILSLIFFLFLLIILPLILAANKKEKVILSKAEYATTATPSATIVPTSPTASSSPTVIFTPSPTPFAPTITPAPTVSSSPSVAPTISVDPSPAPPRPTISIPSVQITTSVFTEVPTAIPIPSISPTLPAAPTIAAPTVVREIGSVAVNQSQWDINQVIDFVAGFFGRAPAPQAPVNPGVETGLDLTAGPAAMTLKPSNDRAQYASAVFIERDIAGNLLGRWFDRLMKKNRQRTVKYEIIINPDGFTYTDEVVLTVKTFQNGFDEPVFRQQTLPVAQLNIPYYFDRYGFFKDINEGQTFYASFPARHNRLHTVTITAAEGSATNRDTKMTLEQWGGLETVRSQSDLIRTKYPTFNPAEPLNLYELSEIITWLNSQDVDVWVTRADLARLLTDDDLVTATVR